MVDFASPETFGTFGAKYIFVHTAGHTYIYIYIQRDKQDCTHGTRTCALMFHKNQKQPY